MTALDTTLARKMHRTLEPYHGFVYFAPEPAAAYAAVGVTDARMGYFASRSAALGAVSAEVVIATFFNFSPDLVRRAIPAAWDLATPAQLLAARLEGVDQALRHILGDEVLEGPEVAEAAELARRASSACTLEGRPLYAAHAALPWPDPPHLVLWQAQTQLREWRGDGHIACLVEQGISGLEALVIHAATGEVPRSVLQASRARTDEEWEAASRRLGERGWLNPDGTATEDGRAHRLELEARTDDLAMAPWILLGSQDCDRLRQLVRPLSRRIVESGTFGFRPPARPEEHS
jgi:hypothetical protein